MNLIITNDNIKLIGVNENLETIDFRDDVGFSAANLDSGFNISDAVTPYVDGNATTYPRPEEVVFYLHAQHVPYEDTEDANVDGDQLTVARTSAEVLTPIKTAQVEAGDFDYATVTNNWSVTSIKDGWIKLQMFALDADSPSQDYYYRSSDGSIVDTTGATDVIVASIDLIDLLPTANVNLLKTSKLNLSIANIISTHTMETIKGKCSDPDAYRKHVAFLQQGRTAAKIQFDTYGNLFNGQLIIESLEKYITVNNLDE